MNNEDFEQEKWKRKVSSVSSLVEYKQYNIRNNYNHFDRSILTRVLTSDYYLIIPLFFFNFVSKTK